MIWTKPWRVEQRIDLPGLADRWLTVTSAHTEADAVEIVDGLRATASALETFRTRPATLNSMEP